MIEKIRKKLMQFQGELTDEQVLMCIEDMILGQEEELPFEEYRKTIERIYARVRSKLGILDLYLKDEHVNEIMINGPDTFFFETKEGIHRLDESFESVEELEEVIRNIAAGVHREINEMHPILDARLDDGSRVNAVYKNIAVGGPILTIRKFARERIRMKDMIAGGTITEECAAFLCKLVRCGYNLFISGGTSSGKTTFLNALSEAIPKDERVIVIEDSTELQLSHIENLVQMECHQANAMGQGEVSMEMLIKTSLRMRPDRIIVGEVRGREVADMLQAMNTGHYGMSTGHGNSAEGMLRRMEAMYLMGAEIPMDAIRAQIVEGIDVLVHLGRLGHGKRMVMEIQELLDYKNGKYVLNPLFCLDENQKLTATGNQMIRRRKLELKGMVT
ncbi:MAG: CpaF family protein [Firmicutes bacterium]|nr:CpaF family protein [Bacillota bacterium]